MPIGMSFIDPTFAIPDADEAARLRRIIKMRLAVIVSLVAHLILLSVVAWMPLDRRDETRASASTWKPPVPITFTAHQPPPVPGVKVDPTANYRMDPTNRLSQPSPARPSAPSNGATGRNDARPAGGRAGGDLPRPAPGAPGGAPVEGADADGAYRDTVPDSPDLTGRLRDFRRALSQPRPASPKGPEGGGSGEGGVQFPALPETGFGVGNLQFESRDYDWSDYGRAVYVAIWRAWHNRLWMTVGNFERWATVRTDWGLDHTSRVRFTITRSGQVEGVAVETESGCIPLDASAYDALREVVLPPLPADFPRGAENVQARFIATGDVRTMRRGLGWLKGQGYF
jgi:hypothetical protein